MSENLAGQADCWTIWTMFIEGLIRAIINQKIPQLREEKCDISHWYRLFFRAKSEGQFIKMLIL